MPLCSGCAGRVAEVSRNVIGWTLIGALGGLLMEAEGRLMAPIATGLAGKRRRRSCCERWTAASVAGEDLEGTISENFRAETDIGPVFVRVSPVVLSSMPSSETQLIWHLFVAWAAHASALSGPQPRWFRPSAGRDRDGL